MKIGIMQPYFIPYIGYWQLINAVDKYVIYDDVQFIKGGWINRNFILLNGQKHLINLLLSGASPNKLINEICVQGNNSKLSKTIELAYKKAPMFEEVFPLFVKIMGYDKGKLSTFLGNSILEICRYLEFSTEIIYSSSLNKNNSLKGQDKILEICRILQADIYINAAGGKDLYQKEKFRSNGIELYFLNANVNSYDQFRNTFIPNLSIIDLMMFNKPAEINEMLNNYTLN